MKKAIKFVVLAICLCLVAMLFRNCLRKDKENETEMVVENPDSIVTEEDLLEKEYAQDKLKASEFERVINSEVEIILLEIKDNYVISHERLKDGLLSSFVNSSISLDIVYTAIFSIPTSAIEIKWLDHTLNVSYDIGLLSVKSVEIDSISSKDSYGIFAKKYTPHEVSALTLLATDYIRKDLKANDMLNVIAEQNLRSYLRNQALKLRIFNITIEP